MGAQLLPARAEWVAVVPQRVADGLAEPSLSALSAAWLEAFADKIRAAGLPVKVSP